MEPSFSSEIGFCIYCNVEYVEVCQFCYPENQPLIIEISWIVSTFRIILGELISSAFIQLVDILATVTVSLSNFFTFGC